MKTVSVDILDDRAIDALKRLEALNIISVQDSEVKNKRLPMDLASKYSGAMSKQSPEEINRQLKELRDEWD